MIRTILVDDEIGGVRVLQKLLEAYCPDVHVLGSADGVETGIQLIQAVKPDLVFLDIEMIQGNAFDLLNRLQPIGFHVIFVTAFDNYVIRAFKYSAIDYLLKPVDIGELCDAVARAMERIKSRNFFDQMNTLLLNMENLHKVPQKMAIPTVNGLSFVPVMDIIRFKAQGNYTSIYLSNGQEVLTTKNIKEYEDILPANIFCRIHNSHIININNIQRYIKGRGGYVILEDGSTIEVASRRREEFLAKFLK